MRVLRPLLLVVAILGLAAPAAQAGPWHIRSLDAGEAFLRGLDARPDRVSVLLDERVRGSDHRLELRVGNKAPQTLDDGRHTFDDVQVDHDSVGNLTVAWSRVPDSGGARQAYVWTARTGKVALGTGGRSVSGLSLDVAGDGGAVIAVWQVGGSLSVARRGPDTPGFGAPAQLAAQADLFPAAVAGPGGRAVVAWTVDGRRATPRARSPARPSGPRRPSPCPPAPTAGRRSPAV